MGDRLSLHRELLRFMPNVYFQPPSNIQMKYPCIVYNKDDKNIKFGDDIAYFAIQGYRLMLIESNPDSKVADSLEQHFQYATIEQYYTVDNLNHTIIQIYY